MTKFIYLGWKTSFSGKRLYLWQDLTWGFVAQTQAAIPPTWEEASDGFIWENPNRTGIRVGASRSSPVAKSDLQASSKGAGKA